MSGMRGTQSFPGGGNRSGGTHGPDSLENYIRQHPKAAGARTLTQARIMAFGRKVSQHGIDVAMNRRPR